MGSLGESFLKKKTCGENVFPDDVEWNSKKFLKMITDDIKTDMARQEKIN